MTETPSPVTLEEELQPEDVVTELVDNEVELEDMSVSTYPIIYYPPLYYSTLTPLPALYRYR